MPRPPNTETRRTHIARGMVRLLARGGVPGATMRALAAETGLAQGVLHYHFPSKHDMVLAALDEIERRMDARLAARGAQDLDALIDALLAPDTPELPADPEALAAWVAIGDAARTDELVRLAYEDAVTRILGHLAARMGGTPDAAALAAAALCQIEGAWRIGHLAPGALPAGFAAATLKRMLRGARAGESPLPLPVAAKAPARTITCPQPDLGVRLRARDRVWWDTLVRASPVDLPASAWSVIAAGYTAPGRHYHTLEHLAEMARGWREVAAGPGWADPRASWLALLFHDVVYDVAGAPGDNEDRSAAMLEALVPDASAAARLVRLTATHGKAEGAALDADAAHFLDCDVAILGAPPARFARYEAQIAAEYAPLVPLAAYRAGRRAFLARMLTLPRIFRSDRFHQRLEARARANLADALAGGA
jgi:predicted metal-dependent HD superfamily phosphohydrolase/AcrR family transcriptional regulator